MARAPVGGGVGEAHAFENPRFVSGGFQTLHVDSDVLKAPGLAHLSNSLGEEGPDPFFPGDLFDDLRHILGVSVVIRFRDDLSLGGLDGKGGEISRRNRVDAQAVAEVVQVDDLSDIVDHTEAAEGVDSFVFGPEDGQTLVRAVFDRG